MIELQENTLEESQKLNAQKKASMQEYCLKLQQVTWTIFMISSG